MALARCGLGDKQVVFLYLSFALTNQLTHNRKRTRGTKVYCTYIHSCIQHMHTNTHVWGCVPLVKLRCLSSVSRCAAVGFVGSNG